MRKLVWHILSRLWAPEYRHPLGPWRWSPPSQESSRRPASEMEAERERPHEAEGPGPGTHKAQSAVRRLRSRASDNTHFLLVSFFKTLFVDTIVCVSRQIYVWSCNFMCSALKEKCHFTIKYNFIVNSICPKRTLLSLQTFLCCNLEEYHLVSYQVQKSLWFNSEDNKLLCPGSAALPGPPSVIFTVLTNFTGIISG